MASASSAGCELLVDFDRSKIPEEGGTIDATTDDGPGPDSTSEASMTSEGGTDSSGQPETSADSGAETGAETGTKDSGGETGPGFEAGKEAGIDATLDTGVDTGTVDSSDGATD